VIRFPPHHKHIRDPAVGESTHCICYLMDSPPPGGCGRSHCVNRTEPREARGGFESATPVRFRQDQPPDWFPKRPRPKGL